MYSSDSSSDDDSLESHRRSVFVTTWVSYHSMIHFIDIYFLFYNFRSLQKDQFLWDSFQDPPAPLHSGSALDNKRFDRLKKMLKLITYICVFVVVLIGAIASKMSYLLMVTFVPDGIRVKFCDVKRKKNAYFVILLFGFALVRYLGEIK